MHCLGRIRSNTWVPPGYHLGTTFSQMIFSRFLKYLKSIAKNRRPSIRCLYNVIKNDVKSMTGSNIRTILREAQVDPRSMDTHALKNWRVYQQADEWTVPLLKNLLEVRADNWEVVYDDEKEEIATDDDINFMIAAICTG